MTAPWEEYAAAKPAAAGPWNDYAGGDAKTAAPAAPPKSASGLAYDASDLAASKFTFGLSDKVGAAGSALGHALYRAVSGKDDGGTIGSDYDKAVAQDESKKAAYVAAHPAVDWATSPLNFLAGGAAKTGLSAVRAGIASGAVAGGAAGAGHSSGSVGDQAAQIALSAGAGALTGGVAGRYAPAIIGRATGAVQGGLGRLAQAVAPNSPMAARAAASQAPASLGALSAPTANKARAYIAERLAADGTDPAIMATQMASARARGVPYAPMDSGPNMQRAAAAIARKSGPGSKIVTDAVASRRLNQGERIQGAIARDLGPTASVRAASDELMTQAKAAAGPLYDAAYAQPAIGTPLLDKLLATPAGRQAVGRAHTIAGNEMRDPAKLGFSLDANGGVVLNPVPVSSMDRLQAAREGHDTAAAALDAVHATEGAKPADIAAAQSAFDKAGSEITAAKAEMASKPASGTVAEQKGYSPQTLDYVKRGLDDIVESHRDPVTGRLNLDEAGRAINGIRAQLVGHLRTLNPTYGQALDAYAGPARMASALAKGAKVAGKSADDITSYMNGMTPPELDQFRLGARSALANSVGDKVDAADRVRALIGTDNKRKALTQVFGGAEGLDNFMATLGHEAATSQTYQRVTGNSKTAENTLDDADLSGVGKAVGAAVHMSGGNPLPALAHVLTHLGDKLSGEAGQKMRAQVAILITETNPEIARELVAAAAKKNAQSIVGRKAVPVVAGAAGRASGASLGALTGSKQ